MQRAVLLALTLLVACDDAGGDARSTEVPTLAALQASVLGPSCAFPACHAGPNPKNGLDLSSLSASAAGLVGVAGLAVGTTRVVPGDPDASLLLQVFDGPVGDVRQMPLGFELSPETRARFRAWIAGGAPLGTADEPPHPAEELPPYVADFTPEDLPPPAPGEGFQMGIDTVAPAGKEIWKCAIAHLPTDVATPVHRVTSLQTRGVHHMDVMALGLLGLDIEDGMYDCDDLYRQYTELMEEGIFIFASQNEREELTLPEGIAATLPPGLQVMVELHFVNPFPQDIPVFSRVNGYTMSPADVRGGIWGSAVRDRDINVPPQTDRHYEWIRCEMNHPVDVIILSSHTHQLAEYVDVYRWSGGQRREPLYENRDWHAPPLKQLDPPLHLDAGEGFEFRCHYRNPTDSLVNWGFGAQDEMCQIAFVHTPLDLGARCEIVEEGAGPTLP
ncbi:MAG: hypothetical protein H6706_02435 [Myxococcales bacterium]|nr:hypothetical protein [Myxococcales bacterium]